jgi:hypothetical protein
MDKEKYNISVAPGVAELVVREGEAKAIKDPERIVFKGHLFTPADFMENRKALLNKENCHLRVDTNAGEVEFYMEEASPFRNVITGTLKRSSVIGLFGINAEKFYGDKELAKFFRKAEYYFENADQHKKIVAELMKFKAKVDVQIEKMQDNRGNTKQLYERMVESNIPESFVMKAPLFDGYDPIEFTVLIGAEADTTGVKFYLESPELFKLEEEEKRRLIGKEVARFTEFGCAILYK